MAKKERIPGPYKGPQPLIEALAGEQDPDRPRTIRELLVSLGFEAPSLDLEDKAEKQAVLKWLTRQSRAKAQPHRVLLAQLLIRNWITDAKYDSFFPGQDRDIDLSIKNIFYDPAADV